MQRSKRGIARLSMLVGLAMVAGLLALGAGGATAVTLPGGNGLIVADAVVAPLGLVAIDPATGTRQALLGTSGADDTPETNPAGNKVVFENGSNIFTADFPAGTSRSQVTMGVTATQPTWSTDGATLFFQTSTGLASAPATASLVAGTPLVGTAAGDVNPQTAPDGTTIVYNNADGIRRIATTGGESVLLTGTAAGDTEPHVSPDGAFVFFRVSSANDIDRLPYPDGGLRNADFGGLINHFDPFVSPDGTLVCADLPAFGLECTPSSGLGAPTAVTGSISGVDDDSHWQRVPALSIGNSPKAKKSVCRFPLSTIPTGAATANVTYGGDTDSIKSGPSTVSVPNGSGIFFVHVKNKKKKQTITATLSNPIGGDPIGKATGTCVIPRRR